MKDTLVKPNIFDHIDIGTYLQAHYQFRKKNTKGFSYESWANDLDIKSRSLLRMMVTGKRSVTRNFAQIIEKSLELNSQERKYYFLLVEYCRAESEEQRNSLWKKMVVLMDSHLPAEHISHAGFISSHLLPKIQTLLTFEDLLKTSENIAEVLGAPVQQVENCLLQLQELSLVSRSESNPLEWVTDIKRFKVPDSIQHESLKNYYIKAFQDSIDAIQLPPETRKFRSLLIPLNKKEYAEVLEKLEDAFREILHQYKSETLEGRRVYQLNTSLFPLSK
ncbi:TIGR02147 family protein [Bdellovibrio sp. KM01]|nr:TIGR02147 family protein [Bdellovibrio sp. KM01]